MAAVHDEEKNLVPYVNKSLAKEEDFHLLRFEFLQRLNMVHLELDLVRMRNKFKKTASDGDLKNLQDRLRDYGEIFEMQLTATDIEKQPRSEIIIS